MVWKRNQELEMLPEAEGQFNGHIYSLGKEGSLGQQLYRQGKINFPLLLSVHVKNSLIVEVTQLACMLVVLN